ncbi:MAG: hypothetical protein AAF968_13880 [Pseudomonadota bacterium]
MKRLTPEERLFADRLRQRRWRRKLRRRERLANSGERRSRRSAPIRILEGPAIFSFSRNYDESVAFLREFKEAAFKTNYGRGERIALEFSSIDEISLAAAVVLSAEVDRWRYVKGLKLSPRNVKNWKPKVRAILEGIGLLRLLDIRSDISDISLGDGLYTIFPISSGKSVSMDKVADRVDELYAVNELFIQKSAVYEVLCEAVNNTVLHAHKEPDARHPVTSYPRGSKRWWMATCYDASRDQVRLYIYDQGVGIPATLPFSETFRTLPSLIRQHLTGPANRDGEAIKAAATSRGTSTGLSQHGRGLGEIIGIPNAARGGRVRIFSGRGSLTFTYGEAIYVTNESAHIGGTLIEWTIPCAQAEASDGQHHNPSN